jgi:putative PIN family toxin of toxin-antitoxin system
MRVLLDTNVLIAAFIARGTCSELLEHCARNHTLVTSPPLLRELEEKPADKFGYTRHGTREVMSLLQNKMEVVEPVVLNPPACRDPDDDVVLATALAGACGCIVTGDKDLLVLDRFREIAILLPADFWRHETL